MSVVARLLWARVSAVLGSGDGVNASSVEHVDDSKTKMRIGSIEGFFYEAEESRALGTWAP